MISTTTRRQWAISTIFFAAPIARANLLKREGVLVGTTCIHAPEELIYAMGATPVRLCNGSYHYDQIGADFMPAKSCPSSRPPSAC